MRQILEEAVNERQDSPAFYFFRLMIAGQGIIRTTSGTGRTTLKFIRDRNDNVCLSARTNEEVMV
jgi:hypothetical protein